MNSSSPGPGHMFTFQLRPTWFGFLPAMWFEGFLGRKLERGEKIQLLRFLRHLQLQILDHFGCPHEREKVKTVMAPKPLHLTEL